MVQNLTSFLVLGQEPSCVGGSVTGLNRHHTVIQYSSESPRAYVYCHKQLNAWPVQELCSKDTAACIIKTNNKNVGTLLIMSIYWDGRINDPPSQVQEAMKLARNKNYTLVMGGDVNCRNTLFRSNITCKRGRMIEDLLVKYDMQIANRGKRPTCTAGNSGSIIDITLSNGETDII